MRRSTMLALAPFVAAALACGGTATAPLQHEGRPAALRFETGGFMSQSVQLELRGDTVVVRRSEPWRQPVVVDSVRTVPDADAWRAFWAAANAAGVHRWRARYADPMVVDGGGFTLLLSAGDRRIETSTANAWPDRSGRQVGYPQPPELLRFLEALDALGGRRRWITG